MAHVKGVAVPELFIDVLIKYSLFIIHTFTKRSIDARPFLFVAMPVPHSLLTPMCGALSAFDAKFWLIWSPYVDGADGVESVDNLTVAKCEAAQSFNLLSTHCRRHLKKNSR